MRRTVMKSLALCARLCRFAAGAALAVLLVLLIILVLARYLAISLPWADELARMTFVWMVALGAAAGLENRAHFALTFFADLAPSRFRSFLERSLAALTAGMLVSLLVALTASIPVVRFSMMPGTGLSRAWLQAPLVVFAALGACFMAGRALLPGGVTDR